MIKAALQLPIHARHLIPHKPPNRFIHRLIEMDGDTAVVESILPSECRLFHTRQLTNVAVLELMAQAYAALKGYLDITNDQPIGRGFLVGIRRFDMRASVDTTNRLLVRVGTTGSFNDFYLAQASVSAGGTPIAEGRLKLWIPSDV